MPRSRLGSLAGAALTVAVALSLHGCGLPKKPKKCSKEGFNCLQTGCCFNPNQKCYARDDSWAECKESCTPSYSESCDLIGKPPPGEPSAPGGSPPAATPAPSSSGSRGGGWGSSSSSSGGWGSPTPSPSFESKPTPAPTPPPPPKINWQEGTFTSSYWDCCQPSCSKEGKGHVDYPVSACKGSEKLGDGAGGHASVCDGGSAGMCPSQQPFKVSDDLSFGFAAVVASGKNGLDGDANCGQCFEWKFTDEQHKEGKEEPWGGAHPDLVGKRMIVQVVHSTYEPYGAHSFDLLVPGAGQRASTGGCKAQFKGDEDDFDCGDRMAGCRTNSSCAGLPEELLAGCSWRHEWYRWLAKGGATNVPYIKFRRVQCPRQLYKITGSQPTDDMDQEYAETS